LTTETPKVLTAGFLPDFIRVSKHLLLIRSSQHSLFQWNPHLLFIWFWF